MFSTQVQSAEDFILQLQRFRLQIAAFKLTYKSKSYPPKAFNFRVDFTFVVLARR